MLDLGFSELRAVQANSAVWDRGCRGCVGIVEESTCWAYGTYLRVENFAD